MRHQNLSTFIQVYNILRYNRLYVLTPPKSNVKLLIGEDTEKTREQEQPKGARILYPEAYGKCTQSEQFRKPKI